MDEIRTLLEQIMDEGFMHMTISNPRKKGTIVRIKVRPILLKGEMCYQQETFDGTQVRHKNYSKNEKNTLIDAVIEYMQEFKQLSCETAGEQITILVNKKLEARIQRKKQEREKDPAGMEQFAYEHNRQKRYILQEVRWISWWNSGL